SDILVNQLDAYIREFGPLTSVFELQAVPGFTKEVFYQIRPFIKVSASRSRDIRNKNQHPSGPRLQEIFREGKFDFIQRFSRYLETQTGFTEPGVRRDGTLETRYGNNPYRIYSRLRYRYKQNVSIGILGEQDAGEVFRWEPAKQYFGYDFLSAHFFLKDFGRIKRVVVGDYTVQVGQGLVMSRGIGYGKGGEVINSVKRANLGIMPYTSVNEANYLRGAATTIAFGKLYFTAFGSSVRNDGSIQITDSSDGFDPEIVATSLQISGLHRTPSEIANRQSITETIGGGRIEWIQRDITIGATHFQQAYSVPFTPDPSKIYKRFDFTGKQNDLTAIDWDIAKRNFNFFGEIARSRSGGFAGIAGILASLHPKVDAVLHLRHFDTNFHSFRGFVFSERPSTLANETGIYLGVRLRPTPKWTISAFIDQFRFPWQRYLVSAPSQGWEFLGQLSWQPSRKFIAYVRYRSDFNQRDASLMPENQQLEFLRQTNRQGLRFDYSWTPERKLRFHGRVEYAWYTKQEEKYSKGMILYQDLSWEIIPKLNLKLRYLIFDTQDYDSRIYAYENDVLTAFSIPAFYEQGSRYYAMLLYSPTRKLDFWVRFAQTRLLHQDTIGSGLDEIQGNVRSELKVQLRIKL
ncbi:MAG: helix-hairpin-helix domain-containing protein, partial [Bacteroidia bacterium]|nr:helix-hairpin-helix domain-containing protein [Bacteroidia bacterium]